MFITFFLVGLLGVRFSESLDFCVDEITTSHEHEGEEQSSSSQHHCHHHCCHFAILLPSFASLDLTLQNAGRNFALDERLTQKYSSLLYRPPIT